MVEREEDKEVCIVETSGFLLFTSECGWFCFSVLYDTHHP